MVQMGIPGVEALTTALGCLPQLITISLSRTKLTSRSATAVCRALATHPSITSVDMSNNEIGGGGGG
jgi:hypothetical protein